MRSFRRFLRYEIVSKSDLKRIKRLRINRQGEALGQALGLPDEVRRDPKNACGLVLLFLSQNYTEFGRPSVRTRDYFAPFLKETWAKFFLVFNSNAKGNRFLFFSDPLIQHLWALFREAKPELISQTYSKEQTFYFRQLLIKMEAVTDF